MDEGHMRRCMDKKGFLPFKKLPEVHLRSLPIIRGIPLKEPFPSLHPPLPFSPLPLPPSLPLSLNFKIKLS
jgi:hypothetical protein